MKRKFKKVQVVEGWSDDFWMPFFRYEKVNGNSCWRAHNLTRLYRGKINVLEPPRRVRITVEVEE